MTLPPNLISGQRARLLPTLANRSGEGRVTSTVLALLPQIPGLANVLLDSMGVRVGRRCRIEAFTEVVFKSEDEAVRKDRPDGMLVVDTSRGTYTILVEVKTGKGAIELDQITRYLDVARANKIDAVLTISNQFVARADHPPIAVPKKSLKNVKLYHWPWMWVRTQCELLQMEGSIEDDQQRFLLDELIRYLRHDTTGVEGFTQMAGGWKDVVRSVGAGANLARTSPDVEKVVASWIEEQRDLCLLLSRRVRKSVKQPIERRLRDDPVARLNHAIENFAKTRVLETVLRVPDAAADILVKANVATKTLSLSMRIRAPEDRKSTKARVSWLLRMLACEDERILIRAHWPSKVPSTQARLEKVRKNPGCLQPANAALAPGWLEVVLVEELGPRFSGAKTFIEDLERVVPEYYELVGQHLREWRAAPPKLVERDSVLPEIVDVNRSDSSDEVFISVEESASDMWPNHSRDNRAVREDSSTPSPEDLDSTGPIDLAA